MLPKLIKGWNTLCDFCPDLHSGRVKTSFLKSELVNRFLPVGVD